MFCLFANALYEWNVTKTNSCAQYKIMSLANKCPRILKSLFDTTGYLLEILSDFDLISAGPVDIFLRALPLFHEKLVIPALCFSRFLRRSKNLKIPLFLLRLFGGGGGGEFRARSHL